MAKRKTKNNRPAELGMTKKEYDNYVAARKESLALSEEYLNFYRKLRRLGKKLD